MHFLGKLKKWITNSKEEQQNFKIFNRSIARKYKIIKNWLNKQN